MAYDSLKNIIRQYIKTNGEQEITGQIMQNVLIEMVNNYPILDGYATQAWVNQQGYVTSSALAGYLPLTGGTLTGNLGMAEGTNIDMTLAESSRRGVYLTLGMHTVDSTDYCLSLQYSPSLTPLRAGIDIDGNMYGEHFIVIGGTASQFLKADGSVDSNSYLPLTGGTMTGSINFTSPLYGINFSNGSQGSGDIGWSSDYAGVSLHSNTKIVLDCNTIWAEGNLTATSFIKDGGTSSQFLKADGSVDSNTYITSAALAGYLPLSGGTMTGSINFTSSLYGINFSNGSQGSGDIGWSSDYAGVSLHSNTKIVLDSNTIWAEGNLTATSFIKDGGTSSQFLKADGSVDSNTYITSAALAGYLPLSGGTMTGSINFMSSAAGINFSDGTQGIGDISYSSLLDGLLLHSNRKIVLDCNTIWAEGNLTATSFIKDGGTSSQFLKADGSVDNNTYITSAALAGYLPLSGGTMTGSINFTSSAYGINFSNGSQGSGDIGWSSDYAGVSLHSNTKIVLDSSTIWAEGNLTATSFIKDGGTSSQFLKADGSVDSSAYITSNGSCAYSTSAGQLANACTIWGQSFDGTGNISGNLREVDNIYASGEFVQTYSQQTGTWYYGYHAGGADSYNLYHSTHGYIYSIKTSGNIGIGTISPSYKLDVNGSANATTLYENGTSLSSKYLALTGGTLKGDLTLNMDGGESYHFNLYSTSSHYANIYADWDGLEINCSHAGTNQFNVNASESYFSGDVYGRSFQQSSDLRKKTITGDVQMNLYHVANAPLFKFTWNDGTDNDMHIGSAAQYWQTVLPELVSIGRDIEQTLAMQYDVIALASAITVAKTVVDHERRIIILERENEELRKELAALKSA